jgi:hypothetical protein
MSGLVRKLVEKWIFDGSDDRLPEAIARFLEFPFDDIYSDYEPAPYSRIEQRLDEWMANVSTDQDQREMFLLFMELFFVGRREFDALYRTAYRAFVLPWIIDHASIDITAQSVDVRISYEVGRTWFCPITDSLRINAFLKANQLKGHEFRPDWRSIRQFGDAKKITDYMDTHGIDRLVLLEDYIGSAIQSADTIGFAADVLASRRVAVCPLIVSPTGLNELQRVAGQKTNLEVRPVLRIPLNRHLEASANAGEPASYAALRELIKRLASIHSSLQASPFGFRHTGSLVVLYSNCPDNVPPVVHCAENWAPLFPRVTR